MTKPKGGRSGRGGKSTKYTGRSNEDNRASSKSIPQKKSFNPQPKGGKDRGRFRGRRGNYKGSSHYRRSNNKSTKSIAPTNDSTSYDASSVSESNKLKRYNPKRPIVAIERLSSYLLAVSQTIKNPHITAVVFRDEVEEDGVKKLIRKPITYTIQEPNYNTIITVSEPMATMTAEQIATINADLQRKFEADEAKRLEEYNKTRAEALREYRTERILSGTAPSYARVEDGFAHPAFVPGVRTPYVQPATETVKTIEVNGQIVAIVEKTLISVPRTISQLLNDGRKELAAPYLRSVETANKAIREHQANDLADRMSAFAKAVSLMEDAVLADVRAYVNRHHPNTTYDQWAARADFVELLNIIEATQHPFFLDYQDETTTKEMIRKLVLELTRNDRYRRITETFSAFFDRYSKTKTYVNQAAVLLQDEQVRISEEQGVEELLTFMRPQGFNINKKIENITLKNEARKTTVAEQIKELLRFCVEDDELIRRGFALQQDNNNDQQRDKKQKTSNKPKDGNDDSSQGQTSSNPHQNGEERTTDRNLLSMLDMAKMNLPIIKDPKFDDMEPSSSSSSSSTKPSYNPRGAPPKGVSFSRGNPGQFRTINTDGRNSSSQSSTQKTQSGSGGSYYNAEPEFDEYYDLDYNGQYLTLEENEPEIVLSASEPRHKRARTEPAVPLSTDPRVLIHDEGNNSSHVISNIDLLPLGVYNLDKTLVLKGQDQNWRTQYSKYGYNPCLGKCIYNETGNVNIINPNILIQDGWEETTFSDQYGIYAKIYKRKFANNLEYTLEFVQNDQGHYVAIDPSLNPGFVFPDPNESASLGEISNLKRFLFNKTNERLRNYVAMKRAGEKADFVIGRHRPLEIRVKTGVEQQSERPARRPRPTPGHKQKTSSSHG